MQQEDWKVWWGCEASSVLPWSCGAPYGQRWIQLAENDGRNWEDGQTKALGQGTRADRQHCGVMIMRLLLRRSRRDTGLLNVLAGKTTTLAVQGHLRLLIW